MLYPGSANGFVALADAYLRSGDRLKAKENYERAVSIEPGHQKAAAMLAQLMKWGLGLLYYFCALKYF